MSSSRIRQLTPEQRALIPEWVARYIAQGLSTAPADWVQADTGVRGLYALAQLTPPPRIVHVPSPLVGGLAAPLAATIIHQRRQRHKNQARSAVGSAIESASSVHDAVESAVELAIGPVESAVGSAVKSAVGLAVGSAVGMPVWRAVASAVTSTSAVKSTSSVESMVRSALQSAVESTMDSAMSPVGSAVQSAVYTSIYAAVGSAVESVESAVKSAVDATVYSTEIERIPLFWHYWYGGQFWSSYTAYMSYVRDVLGVPLPALTPFEQVSSSAGYLWLNRDFAMICDRPDRICRDQNGQLHAEDGMAIRWRDGWGLYLLHGVRVPAWLVHTAPQDIDPTTLLREPNAEVRREIVRKVGVERVCEALGAEVVDRQGDYALLLLDLQDGRRRPYLKMKNPSIGVYHIEGVAPECETVQQALNWRAGDRRRTWAPSHLT